MKDKLLWMTLTLFGAGALVLLWAEPTTWGYAALYTGGGFGFFMGWRMGANSRQPDVDYYRSIAISGVTTRNLLATALVKHAHSLDVTGDDVNEAMSKAEAEVGEGSLPLKESHERGT
jgi:hypothetical protein